MPAYDSFLLASFGGPEGMDDVMPFLENVLRGKNVPRERMFEVAEHYKHFGGISPINQQNRQLLKAIEQAFSQRGIELPVYWGNRNWHPLFPETLRQMREKGHRRTIAFFTSMFSSHSGCRQYRENLDAARQEVGEDAPVIDKVRMGFNHPYFIEAVCDSIVEANAKFIDSEPRKFPMVFFTAHSIPHAMADHCDYGEQLHEACRLVAEQIGIDDWKLVYQSRSGPPSQPWLEPDVCDAINNLQDHGSVPRLILMPIGFVSDHLEVLFDLDTEAATVCQERGITMQRASTVGSTTLFVEMICELVEERLGLRSTRKAIGSMGPWHEECPSDCCSFAPRRPS